MHVHVCFISIFYLSIYIKLKKKLTVSLWPLTVDSVRGCGTAEGPDAGRALQ